MIIKVLNLMRDRKPVEVDEEGSDGGPFGLVENEACCYTLNPRMELAGTPGSSAFLSSFEITRAWTSSRVVVVCVFFFPKCRQSENQYMFGLFFILHWSIEAKMN